MDLNLAATNIHNWSKEHGFWEHETLVHRDPVNGDVEGRLKNPSIVAEKLCLIHSEVSEALESERDGDTNTAEELADIIIRVLDLCGYRGYDIEKEITDKLAVNELRPYKHGRQM